MRKKKSLIIFALPMIFILIFAVIYSISDDKIRVEGRYLISDNGTHLIVSDYGTEHDEPFEMYSQDESIFEGLTSGDKIRVTTDGYILECYPGIIGVFSCKKLEDGDLEDISEAVLQKLISLDWISLKISQTITISNKEIYLSVDLPDKWNYELVPNNQGIRIWPQSDSGGSVDILYYPEGIHAEMLSDHEAQIGYIDIGGYEITRYHYFDLDYNSTYDWLDLRSWDYIQFSEPYDKYLIFNNGADIWNDLENITLQNIIRTIKLSEQDKINAMNDKPIKKVDTKDMYKVTYQNGGANVSIQLFDNWDYKYLEAKSSEDPHGISFWPKSTPEGSIDLLFYPGSTFQLDDLSKMETNYCMVGAVPDGSSMYEAAIISYPRDDDPLYNFLESKFWDYVQLSVPYNQYVFVNNSSDRWTKQDDYELPYIIDSIKFY